MPGTPITTRLICSDVPKNLKLHNELEEDLERIGCQQLFYPPWDIVSKVMLLEKAQEAESVAFGKHAIRQGLWSEALIHGPKFTTSPSTQWYLSL